MRALTFDEIGQVVGGQSAPPSGGGTSGTGGNTGGTSGGTSPAPGADRTLGREPDGGLSVFEGAYNRTQDFLGRFNLAGRAAEIMDEGLEWIERNNMGTSGAYATAKIGEPLQPPR